MGREGTPSIYNRQAARPHGQPGTLLMECSRPAEIAELEAQVQTLKTAAQGQRTSEALATVATEESKVGRAKSRRGWWPF